MPRRSHHEKVLGKEVPIPHLNDPVGRVLDRGHDLDLGDATLVFLSVANWAYTWLTADHDVGGLTARLMSIMLGGMETR